MAYIHTYISINAIVTGNYKGKNVLFREFYFFKLVFRSKLNSIKDLNLDRKQT